MARPANERVQDLLDGLHAGDRGVIARAITLVESTRPDHRRLTRLLLAGLPPVSASVRRIGITGVPGVGKSTLIQALGQRLLDAGHRVAVLAIDPSSGLTGGSILGDRTRMAELASSDRAFVRPAPNAGTLGGVANATRESMRVLEAAGFDVVLVETVGVGQSEYVVADMVDSFLFLTLARTGDQLQAMKRGILELADVVAVNKADGDSELESRRAAVELEATLHIAHAGVRSDDDEAGGRWQPPVLTCSGLTGAGLDELWQALELHRAHVGPRLDGTRLEQQVSWTRDLVRHALLEVIDRADVQRVAAVAEAAVRAGELGPGEAAQEILTAIAEPSASEEGTAIAKA